MQRLTTRSKSGCVFSCDSSYNRKDTLERLAAYEDAGLEPNEVNALRMERDAYELALKKAVAHIRPTVFEVGVYPSEAELEKARQKYIEHFLDSAFWDINS